MFCVAWDTERRWCWLYVCNNCTCVCIWVWCEQCCDLSTWCIAWSGYRTPLMLAASRGHVDMTTFLVSALADVNAVDIYQRTTLHMVVRYLLPLSSRLILSQHRDVIVAMKALRSDISCDFNSSSHTHTRLTALCPGLPGWAGTRKVKPIWILLKQETVSGSGISLAICKSAPRSRQITMPAPRCSGFYRPDALPAAQPTVSKHWMQCRF